MRKPADFADSVFVRLKDTTRRSVLLENRSEFAEFRILPAALNVALAGGSFHFLLCAGESKPTSLERFDSRESFSLSIAAHSVLRRQQSTAKKSEPARSVIWAKNVARSQVLYTKWFTTRRNKAAQVLQSAEAQLESLPHSPRSIVFGLCRVCLMSFALIREVC